MSRFSNRIKFLLSLGEGQQSMGVAGPFFRWYARQEAKMFGEGMWQRKGLNIIRGITRIWFCILTAGGTELCLHQRCLRLPIVHFEGETLGFFDAFWLCQKHYKEWVYEDARANKIASRGALTMRFRWFAPAHLVVAARFYFPGKVAR